MTKAAEILKRKVTALLLKSAKVSADLKKIFNGKANLKRAQSIWSDAKLKKMRMVIQNAAGSSSKKPIAKKTAVAKKPKVKKPAVSAKKKKAVQINSARNEYFEAKNKVNAMRCPKGFYMDEDGECQKMKPKPKSKQKKTVQIQLDRNRITAIKPEGKQKKTAKTDKDPLKRNLLLDVDGNPIPGQKRLGTPRLQRFDVEGRRIYYDKEKKDWFLWGTDEKAEKAGGFTRKRKA